MDKELYEIQLSYAYAAIVVENGIITKTAPIFNWMRQKTLREIEPWVAKKNGKINKINIKLDKI